MSQFLQKFGGEPDYHLLCMGCEHPIESGHFFVEVRQYHLVDSDAKLAVHVSCLDRLHQPGDGLL